MPSHVASFCSYVCTSASQTGFRRLSGEISSKRMRNLPVDAKNFAKRIQNGLKAAAEEHVSGKSRPIGAEILFGEWESRVSRNSWQAWRPRSYEAAKYGVLAFQRGGCSWRICDKHSKGVCPQLNAPCPMNEKAPHLVRRGAWGGRWRVVRWRGAKRRLGFRPLRASTPLPMLRWRQGLPWWNG